MELLQHLTDIALKEKDKLHEDHNGHLVSYLFVKGNKVEHATNQACYYQVENGVPWKHGITGIISSLVRNNHSEDTTRKWLEFHTNDPVFGKSILSKDVDWMLEHKLVIHDTSAPGNLMQGVMVSIRQLWEYDQIVKSYVRLIDSGINHMFAYNLAHYLRVMNSGKEYELSVYSPGHNLFYGDRLTKRHMKMWFNGTLDHPLDPYIERSAYSGTANMFDRQAPGWRGGDLQPWVEAWIKKIMKPKEAGSTNPFGKAKANNVKNLFPIDELNKALKKNEKAMIKEIME